MVQVSNTGIFLIQGWLNMENPLNIISLTHTSMNWGRGEAADLPVGLKPGFSMELSPKAGVDSIILVEIKSNQPACEGPAEGTQRSLWSHPAHPAAVGHANTSEASLTPLFLTSYPI